MHCLIVPGDLEMKLLILCSLCLVAAAAGSSTATAWPGGVELPTTPLAAQPTPLAALPALPTPLAALPAPYALGAPLLKTLHPASTKSFGYSTSQFINSPPFPYAFGYQPQYAYPELSPVAPIQGYYPYYPGASYPAASFPVGSYPAASFPAASFPAASFPAASFPAASFPAVGYPGASFIYPPPSPILGEKPSAPAINFPAPSPPAGDSDSAIIDSADQSAPQFPEQPSQNPEQNSQFQELDSQFPQQGSQFPELSSPAPQFPGQQEQAEKPQQPFPEQPKNEASQQPAASFPFPPSQQDSAFPTFPQIQFPQGSIPSFPQFPQFPQFPSSPQNPPPQAPGSTPPPSFASGDGSDRGLNDEDTISVESA